jgi:class 3 adenylate cyclase
MMSIVYDHGGYVEKNTGDGLMAVIGAGAPREEAVNSTLDVAATMRYALDALVNPQLRSLGLPEIQIRIAADWGILLLARIGVPTGRADQPRSYLTAVGAAANHASKLVEDAAKPGDILVGDFIKAYANPNRAEWFLPATPAGWAWYYINTGSPYWVWRYTEARSGGLDALLRSALEPYRGL